MRKNPVLCHILSGALALSLGAANLAQAQIVQTAPVRQSTYDREINNGVNVDDAQMQNDEMAQIIRPQQAGNITYVTGGIGEDEIAALKATASRYNLTVIDTDKDGHYTADVTMEILGGKGREVLRAASTGPLFYAKLPPGDYVIKASNGGENEQRKVHIVARKMTVLHLAW